MNELTRTVLEDFATWVESKGHRPVDLTPVADLCDVKAIVLDRIAIDAGRLTEPNPRYWVGDLTGDVLRFGLYLVATEADWLLAAQRAMPLFFDYLATLDTEVVTAQDLAGARAGFAEAFPAGLHPKHPSASAMLGRLLVDAPDVYDKAEKLSWAELEALAGPALGPPTGEDGHLGDGTSPSFSSVLGSVAPVPVPSILARLAEESELMTRLITVARATLPTGQRPDGVDDWLWRQVVVQALVGDPRLLAGLSSYPGASLRQWDSGRPELKARVWSRAFQCVTLESALGPGDEAYPAITKAILQVLTTANVSGQARIQDIITTYPDERIDPARLQELADRLQSLGALTIDGDTIRLTTLGSAGLHQLGNWTGIPAPEPLLIPSWSNALVRADVAAVLNAVADERASIGPTETFPGVWLEHASPMGLAGPIIDAMPWLTDRAHDMAWSVLLAIGEPAAPVIRTCLNTWLDREARSWLTAGRHDDLLPPDEVTAVVASWTAASENAPQPKE